MCAQVELAVALEAPGGPEGRQLVAIRVTDTGPGIPPEHLSGIWASFNQARVCVCVCARACVCGKQGSAFPPAG